MNDTAHSRSDPGTDGPIDGPIDSPIGSPAKSPLAVLQPLGKLEEALASDASLEVKRACIDLAILARDNKAAA